MSFAQSIAGHPLLGERLRLRLMVAITAAEKPVEFVHLLESLDVTKGNLSSHLRKLEDAGLIQIEKHFVDRKPRTCYRCSEFGRAALKSHLDDLEQMILSMKAKAS